MGRRMMRCATLFMLLVCGCGGQEFTAASGGGGGGGGGGTGGGDGGAGWCASRPTPPTFCADFDETTDLQAVVSQWSAGIATTGSETAHVQADPSAPSAPNVLSATADGTALLAKSGSVTIGETIARQSGIATVHAETMLRLDQGKVTGDLDSATVLGVFINGNTVFLGLTKTGFVLGIQEAGDAGALGFAQVPGQVAFGQWDDYALDIDVRNGKAHASHNGVDVADTTLPVTASVPQTTTMAIGVVTFGQTGEVGFSFDDVRMDVNAN